MADRPPAAQAGAEGASTEPAAGPPLSFAEAFARLQADIPRITRGTEGQVGTRRYSYANLANIQDVIWPILDRHGFIWITEPDLKFRDGQPPLFVLAWELQYVPTGESRTGLYPLATGTPQTQGGQLTYAARYALTRVLNITTAEDDDDAAAAEAEATKGAADWKPPADPRTRRAARERDTAGEENEWQTPGPGDTEAKNQPGSISDSQKRMLQARFREAGYHTHEDHMRAIAKHLPGVTVTGTAQLSFTQAADLARRLAAKKRGGEQ